MEIVIADNNLQKITELKSLLKDLPFLDVLSLRDFPQDSLPPEATAVAKKLDRWAISDTSGLVIPALLKEGDDQQSFFKGETTTDADRRRELLTAMEMMEGMKRHAYFVCRLTLASPKGVVKEVNATCEGLVTKETRGGAGFGFDALFVKHDYDKTFAELDLTTKNRVSHRRKAFDKLQTALEALDDRS